MHNHSPFRAGVLKGVASAFWCVAALTGLLPAQTVQVVNMIPLGNSAESKQNSEPSIGLYPGATPVIIASAATPDAGFCGPSRAAAFLSEDDGDSWDLACILPKSILGYPMDVTVRFSGDGLALYASSLRATGSSLSSAYVSGFRKHPMIPLHFWLNLVADGVVKLNLLTRLLDADQPQLMTAPVGFAGFANPVPKGTVVAARVNSLAGICPAKGIVSGSENPFVGPATSDFCIAARGNRLTPAIRIAAHTDGTAYAIFYRYVLPAWDHLDVVVVRHDAGGGAAVFQALKDLPDDPGSPTDAETMESSFCSQRDGGIGYRLKRCVMYPTPTDPAVFGQERRVWSQLAVAINPNDSKKVYVAWGDSVGGSSSHLTLHFASSADGGASWTESAFTVDNGTNPALAVADDGVLGMMYQKLVKVGAAERWQTWFRLVPDGGTIKEFMLAEGPASEPVRLGAPGKEPYLGDYIELKAKGNNFYGVFSATNDRSSATFLAGTVFHRKYNAEWKPTTETGVVVAASIDPYFVRVTRP